MPAKAGIQEPMDFTVSESLDTGLRRYAEPFSNGLFVMSLPKLLIVIGITLVAVGLLWPWLQKLGLGRLPGDIVIERENARFYFPLTTSILVSLILSLLFWFFRK